MFSFCQFSYLIKFFSGLPDCLLWYFEKHMTYNTTIDGYTYLEMLNWIECWCMKVAQNPYSLMDWIVRRKKQQQQQHLSYHQQFKSLCDFLFQTSFVPVDREHCKIVKTVDPQPLTRLQLHALANRFEIPMEFLPIN